MRQFVASYDLGEPDGTRQMISFWAYDEADAHQRIELMRQSLVLEGSADKMKPRD